MVNLNKISLSMSRVLPLSKSADSEVNDTEINIASEGILINENITATDMKTQSNIKSHDSGNITECPDKFTTKITSHYHGRLGNNMCQYATIYLLDQQECVKVS